MEEKKQGGKGLAIASLVLGILAIINSFIPFLNFISYIFAILAIIFGIIGIVKKTGKGLSIAGLILGGLTIIVATIINIAGIGIIASSSPKDPASSYNSDNNSENFSDNNKDEVKKNDKAKKNNYSLGETFEFDGFEVTFDKDFSYVTLDNQFSEYHGSTVIKLGATIKNNSGETGNINMFYMKTFGSQGTELSNVDYYFDESITEAGDLRDGASYHKYFYILYDGNGKYGIDFDNYVTKKTVEFDVAR